MWSPSSRPSLRIFGLQSSVFRLQSTFVGDDEAPLDRPDLAAERLEVCAGGVVGEAAQEERGGLALCARAALALLRRHRRGDRAIVGDLLLAVRHGRRRESEGLEGRGRAWEGAEAGP